MEFLWLLANMDKVMKNVSCQILMFPAKFQQGNAFPCFNSQNENKCPFDLFSTMMSTVLCLQFAIFLRFSSRDI